MLARRNGSTLPPAILSPFKSVIASTVYSPSFSGLSSAGLLPLLSFILSSLDVIAASGAVVRGPIPRVGPVVVVRATAPVTAGASVSVIVAGRVVLALDDHLVVIAAVVVSNEERKKLFTHQQSLSAIDGFEDTHKGDEEEDNLNDAQREAGLEHSTVLVDIETPRATRLLAIVPKRSKTDKDASRVKVGAVGITDAAQKVDAGDESADKGKVNERNEERRVSGSQVGDERADRPYCAQHARDEEDQDICRCQLVRGDEAVHKVGQHAEDGDERDDFEDPKGQEEEAGERHLSVLDELGCR